MTYSLGRREYFCSFIYLRNGITHLLLLQVQKITNNIQFILETVMLSNIVEVQVMFSLYNYCYMISNMIPFGQKTYRLFTNHICFH
jgi:hypothetical protein